MPKRAVRGPALDWEELVIDRAFLTPSTPALCGPRGTGIWREVLEALCDGRRLRGLLARNEQHLRELLLERLPTKGIPPAQVLGMTEELQVTMAEAVQCGVVQPKDFDRFCRTVVAVEGDARRASGVAAAVGRVAGARVVNWCDMYKQLPGDDDRLERCEAFSVTEREGETLRLESASGVTVTVPVGRWAVGRARVGDRFFMEVRSGTDGPRIVRVAAAAPVAAITPEGDPADRPDVLRPEQVVRLHVSPSWAPKITRDVELLGSHTLDDLHGAIQDAFGWGGGHLYLFGLGRAQHDRSAYYMCGECDEGERFTADATLASLALYPRRRFWYLFDFGDELWHDLRVLRVGPRAPRIRYPRLAARSGRVPRRHGW